MISQKVMFRPRRLGHGNLFVSDLETSMEFYTRVCGLTEVFREPPIKAGFLSNGSSHHDIALIETSDKTRLSGDGQTLISDKRGTRSGLNHFGWEMETEAELVEAYDRARDLEIDLHRTVNHQVSHSVYLFDPEGNYHEFYADATDNWREVWRRNNADVLTVKWSPEEAPPSTSPRYTADADLKPAPDAVIPTRQVRHGALVASDYQGLLRFYTEVAGLEITYSPSDGSFAVLSGTLSGRDLTILPATEGRSPGMHHVGFELFDERELLKAEERLKSEGISPETVVDHPTKRAVFLKDPDGILLEFYVDRPMPLTELTDTKGYDPAFLI
jgi:catechol 2,3-dioxygenase